MRVIAFLEIRGAGDAQLWVPETRKKQFAVFLKLLEDSDDAPAECAAFQREKRPEELVEFHGPLGIFLSGFCANERLNDDGKRASDPVFVFKVGNAIHELRRLLLSFGTRRVEELLAHRC